MSASKNEVESKSPVKPSVSGSKIEETKASRQRRPREENDKKPKYSNKAPKVDGPRRNNVIIVRQNTRFKTLVILAKNLLKS
mgnify:CR=1 FL=1